MIKQEIGKTAGEVWKYLGKNTRIPITDLPNKVNKNPENVHQALGWLAREDKVQFTREGRMTYVTLTDPERNHYQKSQWCPRNSKHGQST